MFPLRLVGDDGSCLDSSLMSVQTERSSVVSENMGPLCSVRTSTLSPLQGDERPNSGPIYNGVFVTLSVSSFLTRPFPVVSSFSLPPIFVCHSPRGFFRPRFPRFTIRKRSRSFLSVPTYCPRLFSDYSRNLRSSVEPSP